MSLLDLIGESHQRVLRPSGGCHNCPRRRVDFVPATLRRGKILWLGEAPGATEVKEQEGFVGASGKLLRQEAHRAGVPAPWSFSNVVHCRPPENATPKLKEINCCLSQFVLDEVRQYPIVVLVGAVALQAFFPGAKTWHFRGNFAVHPDFPGTRFYTISHPAYILRRRDLLPEFRRHLERLARVASGSLPPPPVAEIVRGGAAIDLLREMVQGPVLSLDLETTGTESWTVDARIKSVAVTDKDAERVAVFYETDPVFVAALEIIHAFLRDPTKAVVGSNIAFDVEWLEREGEYLSAAQLHDVSLIWYEAAQYKQASLKLLTEQRLDGYRHLVYQPHETRDPEAVLQYNAEDVVYAMRLFVAGMRDLPAQTIDLLVRALQPMSLLYRRATTHGIYIRQDYRLNLIEQYHKRRAAAVAAWRKADPAFVPTQHESGNGLLEYLFKIKKLPVLTRTDGGQPAVDKAAVHEWVRGGATYLRHLLDIRSIDKQLSTYLTGYDGLIDGNSRVHPRHWLTSTDTSRPSSSEPNVYNVTRDDEIRDQYGAPPGGVLLESDLSQIEFRIMVCLARDEAGLQGYLVGKDAHSMTAAAIAGPKFTKRDRSHAKAINFALLYGGNAYNVVRTARNMFGIDFTERQAEEFVEKFFGLYRGFLPFHADSRRRLILNRGRFTSVTGHNFVYEDWNHEDQGRRDHAFRSALNAEAQGPAANICFYIAVLARQMLDARGFERAVFVNSVYDSIVTEVPDPKWVPAIAATLDEAAEQARAWVPWFRVPLLLEHAAGKSWGQLQPVR